MKRTPEEMLNALACLFFDDEIIAEMDDDEIATELNAYGFNLSNIEKFADNIRQILETRHAEMGQNKNRPSSG